MGPRKFSFFLSLVASWGCSEQTSDDAVLATRVQGAWIFYHSTLNHDDALYEGPATIDDGDCLLIGASVVVWFREDAPEVERIISEVRAGSNPMIRVGGGMGTTARSEVVDKCPVADVWYGAPMSVSFEQDTQ